jgi:hypothetical protein
MPDDKGFWDYPDIVEAAPDQAKVEYEDLEIRVIRFSLPAGATAPMHRHPGRVDVLLTDVNARTVRPDGTERTSHSKAGESGYADPVVHEGHNIGEEEWVMIEVEFKERNPAGFASAVPPGL